MLAVLTLAACSNNKIQNKIDTTKKVLYIDKKDTIAYTYKGQTSQADSCKNKNGCSYIAVSYPLFKNDSLLNDTIEHIILDKLRPYINEESEKSKNFENTLKNIVGIFSQSDSTSEQETPTTYDLNINIISQDSSLLVIDIGQESSGGAHPNVYEEYRNWNTKTDEIISLNDLLIDDYDKKFTSIAEKIFRKNAGLSKDAPLDNYNFDDGAFRLNDNFKITPKGISFFYNTYEIQSYVSGPTELLIPYSQIKSLLRPNTVVAQYIK